MPYTTRETMELLDAVKSPLFNDAKIFYNNIARGDNRRVKVASEAMGDEISDIISTQLVSGILDAIHDAFKTKPVLAAIADEKLGKIEILSAGMIYESAKRFVEGDNKAVELMHCFAPNNVSPEELKEMMGELHTGPVMLLLRLLVAVYRFSPKELSEMTLREFLDTSIGRLRDIPVGEIVGIVEDQMMRTINDTWAYAAQSAQHRSRMDDLNGNPIWGSEGIKDIHDEAKEKVDEILDDTKYIQKNLVESLPGAEIKDGRVDVEGWAYRLFSTIINFTTPDSAEWADFMEGEN